MTLIQTLQLSLSDLDSLCKVIAKHIQEGDVFALSGDLGAGKTTFVSHVAKYLQLPPGTVSSPTYVLHHIYPSKFSIHHIDLYRLENSRAIMELGFDEFLGQDGVAFIEWFEKFPEVWTGPCIQIQMKISDADHRTYAFSIVNGTRDHWSKMFDDIKKV